MPASRCTIRIEPAVQDSGSFEKCARKCTQQGNCNRFEFSTPLQPCWQCESDEDQGLYDQQSNIFKYFRGTRNFTDFINN